MPRQNLIFIALVIALFGRGVFYDFAYDDLLIIQENKLVTTTPFSFAHLLTILASKTPPGDLYRPLSIISYWVDYLMCGLNPVWFHTVNLGLYIILVVLINRIFLLLSLQPKTAFVATLVFAAHPLHVEAVTNIVGRAELLATLFACASLLFFFDIQSDQSEKQYKKISLLGAFSSLMAFLSKESALTLIPLLLAAHILFKDRRKCTAGVLRYFLALQCFAALISLTLRGLALGNSFFVQPESSALNPENPLLGLSFTERFLPALKVLGEYLLLILCPCKLSADYSQLLPSLMSETYSITGVVLIGFVVLYAALLTQVTNRMQLFFGLWFFITFALTSNIIVPIGTIMADRLTLLPSIGAIGFFCFVVAPYLHKNAKVIAALVIILLSIKTYSQIPIWKDNRTLFQSMIDFDPNNPKALYNYGIYLYTHDKDLVSAEHYLQKVLELIPDHLYSMKTIADIELAKGDAIKLRYWYERILRSYPEEAQVKEQLEKLNSLQ